MNAGVPALPRSPVTPPVIRPQGICLPRTCKQPRIHRSMTNTRQSANESATVTAPPAADRRPVLGRRNERCVTSRSLDSDVDVGRRSMIHRVTGPTRPAWAGSRSRRRRRQIMHPERRATAAGHRYRTKPLCVKRRFWSWPGRARRGPCRWRGVGRRVGCRVRAVTCPKSRLSGCEAGHAGSRVVPGVSSRAHLHQRGCCSRRRASMARCR
jgi:hypothetical protein